MSFWEKTVNTASNNAAYEAQTVVLDEQVMAELQQDPQQDIFDEDEAEDQFLMSDVQLRLEQGRLYQLVLQGNIFDNIDADPRAVKNVQREIRKFVRERMETMVGIRQEQAKETIVSSQFNDMEVTALKMVAAKVTNGATTVSQKQAESVTPPPPKKDGITGISGSLRPQNSTPLSRTPSKPVAKPQPKPVAPKPIAKSAISAILESNLTKPIEEMTAEELSAHNKAAEDRSKNNKAKLPSNMTPHPTPQQLEMMYTAQASSTPFKIVPPNT